MPLAGAGAVRNVHYAVCSVLPAKNEDLAVKTGREKKKRICSDKLKKKKKKKNT